MDFVPKAKPPPPPPPQEAKTVEQYKKEKEEEEIFNSLNKFNTINEINRSFGINPNIFANVVTPGRSAASSPMDERTTNLQDSIMGSTDPK